MLPGGFQLQNAVATFWVFDCGSHDAVPVMCYSKAPLHDSLNFRIYALLGVVHETVGTEELRLGKCAFVSVKINNGCVCTLIVLVVFKSLF